MIQFVDFVSAAKIEAMQGDSRWAVISITDPGSSDTRIPRGFGPVLRLKFDDLDDESIAGGSEGLVFSPSDADAVLNFLADAHRNTAIHGVIVHCEMGRSRSGAIAWYALSYGGEMVNSRRIDGYNNLVLKTLESVGGRSLPRPTTLLVPSGFWL